MVIYHVRAAMSVLSRRAVFAASSAAALSAARLDRLAPDLASMKAIDYALTQEGIRRSRES